jgi:hypothetical protein
VGAAELSADVHAHSREAGFASVERPETRSSTSAASTPEHAGVAAAYARVSVLVYGQVPALGDVLARIQEREDLMCRNETGRRCVRAALSCGPGLEHARRGEATGHRPRCRLEVVVIVSMGRM